MSLELYSNQRSPICDWDPRARMVSLTALMVSIVTLQSLALAAFGLAISLAVLVISRIPLRTASRSLKWPLMFLLPFLFILPFTVEGTAAVSISVFNVSREGLFMGLLIFTKGIAALILGLTMLGSAPFYAHAMALRDLHLPDPLVQIFLFTYRYIDLLGQELSTTFRSLSSRGFESQSSARTARVMGSALGALLLRSMARSERMFFAMASRGYEGKLPGSRAGEMMREDWIKSLPLVGIALTLQVLGVMQWVAP